MEKGKSKKRKREDKTGVLKELFVFFVNPLKNDDHYSHAWYRAKVLKTTQDNNGNKNYVIQWPDGNGKYPPEIMPETHVRAENDFQQLPPEQIKKRGQSFSTISRKC